MRSSSLAEPEFESNTTGFNVILYHKSLYDPNVKLWLSTFDQYKLTENQLAVLALGYGGKEFSTQDIIERLGIVDTDDIQRVTTPLRKLGILSRTRTHMQAYRYAELKRVPKREVPTYRVCAPEQATPSDLEEDPQEDEPSTLHRIHIGNLPYSVDKTQLLNWLSTTCEVTALDIPAGFQAGHSNRGFAFATVVFDGKVEELIAKLDGGLVGTRRVRVHTAHPKGAA